MIHNRRAEHSAAIERGKRFNCPLAAPRLPSPLKMGDRWRRASPHIVRKSRSPEIFHCLCVCVCVLDAHRHTDARRRFTLSPYRFWFAMRRAAHRALRASRITRISVYNLTAYGLCLSLSISVAAPSASARRLEVHSCLADLGF